MDSNPPKHHQIHRGVAVNIVLKADQPTGKLTTGHVSDVLTRHDHPRGVKVRLANGQIGRVQSLGSLGPTKNEGGQSQETASQHFGQDLRQEATWDRRSGYRGGRMQEDYRNDPEPPTERGLEDYVVIKPAKKKGRKGRTSGGKGQDTKSSMGNERMEHLNESNQQTSAIAADVDVQLILEKEFPDVDTALIAAILFERQNDTDAARDVLKAISG